MNNSRSIGCDQLSDRLRRVAGIGRRNENIVDNLKRLSSPRFGENGFDKIAAFAAGAGLAE